jgi:hypothetical protein
VLFRSGDARGSFHFLYAKLKLNRVDIDIPN